MRILTPLFLLPIVSVHADLSLLPVPENRGTEGTAYAEFDSFAGLSDSNALGATNADSASGITNPRLIHSTPIFFPGGVKYNTATDRRVYTFVPASNWSLTGTPDVQYDKATLRIHEFGNAGFGSGPDSPGMTDYTFSLNSIAPTSKTVEAFVFDAGTATERYQYVTTITWLLDAPTNDLSISINGYADAHDSIDAFVLDLERQPSLTKPSISIVDGMIQLSWPTSANAILQSSSNLTSPGSWTDVAAEPTEENGMSVLSLPLEGPSKFFRLRAE